MNEKNAQIKNYCFLLVVDCSIILTSKAEHFASDSHLVFKEKAF